MKKRHVTWLLCGMLVCFVSSCMKDFEEMSSPIYSQTNGNYVPWVKTGDVSAVGSNSVTVAGGLDREEMEFGLEVWEYGILYSSDAYGDLEYNGMYLPVADENAKPDNFTLTLEDLKGGTTYVYCTYIRTERGEYTGRIKNFITLPAEMPQPSMPVVENRTAEGVYVMSRAEGEGTDQNYAKGFYWKRVTSTFEEPSRENHDGAQDINWGDYFSTFVEFDSPDAVYAIRAYVHSYETDETVYSETLFCGLKEEAMISPVMVSEGGAGAVTFRAMALNFGNMNITEKGFCYSDTHSAPVVDADTKVMDATSTEMERIEALVEGLNTSEHFYYVRAYCVADGTTYYGPTYIYGTREPGIYTVEDLVAFRDARNNYDDVSMWKNANGEINLYSDLDMSIVSEWIPIRSLDMGETFNGNEHTITNLTLTALDFEDYRYDIGFIVNNHGTVKDLHIGAGSRASMSFPDDKDGYAGSICVSNEMHGVVSGCTSVMDIDLSSKSNSREVYVGGLVGKNWGRIEDCEFGGILSAQSTSALVGGIAAQMTVDTSIFPSIIGSVNKGTVGKGLQCLYIGGIVGQSNGAPVTSCTNEGIVTGNQESEGVGGIVGRGAIHDSDKPLIDLCVNAGEVNNGANTGGIAGYLDGGVTNCKNTAAISSDGYAGSICGTVGYEMNMFTGNTNEGTVNGVPGDYIGNDRRPPLISEVTVVSFTATTAVLSATILDQGGASVSNAGFQYSTIDEIYNTSKVDGVIEGNTVTCTLTNLVPGTKYFVWGYARNLHNTNNSVNSVSFVTSVK